jgi:anti-sigma factor RsiW
MSSRDPHLEVLINRYLDGEISAREMEDLRSLVDGDDDARELFAQMQSLHHACQEAVQTRVLQPGRPVEDLIASAWEGQGSGQWAGRVKKVVFSQFAYGLAAGLLVAVSVHLVLASLQPAGTSLPGSAGQRVAMPTNTDRPGGVSTASADEPAQEDGLPQVNLYYYTDSQGTRWVIEGLSEERVRTVADQRGF